jgi:hypothetical protein
MDLGNKLGHAEAQDIPPLAAGADHPATAITPRVALRGPPGVFLLDLIDELDLSAILIPAQAKDPRGEKGFDPRMMTMLLLYAYRVGIVSSRLPGRRPACRRH